MVQAYSRANPRYRRLYATKDLQRKGFRKAREEMEGRTKVLVYVRRSYERGSGEPKLVVNKEARVYPDGTVAMTEIKPETL